MISRFDSERLVRLLGFERSERSTELVDALVRKLIRSRGASSDEVPSDVVTMNTTVLTIDLATEARKVYTLVFPANANHASGSISVFDPLGIALLGSHVGDVLEWDSTGEIRSLRVDKILYQPEAAGDFHR
jgi:regulator of nucleoside diphosphate kinase